MKDTCRAVYGGASMINRDCRLTCLVPISMEAIHRSWVNFIFTPFYMFHYFNSLRFSDFTLHVPIGHAPYRGRDGNSRAFSRMARMLSLYICLLCLDSYMLHLWYIQSYIIWKLRSQLERTEPCFLFVEFKVLKETKPHRN
jgi:hypothetical protein